MCRARVVAALLGVLAARATGAAPIPWTEARDHVRRLVTVEGVVARASTPSERRCVLEFDPDDPAALRVILLVPWITDLPADPARLYQGKRVQVTGRVTRFRDRLEMMVTPAQLEVVGLTAPPAAAPVPPAGAPAPPPRAPAPAPPAAPAPARREPAPAGRPAPPAPSAPAPAIPAVAVPPVTPSTLPAPVAPPDDPRCPGWREERAAVQREIRDLTRRLEECLAAGRTGCPGLGDRLGPPLSRLEAVEQRLERYCP